MNLLKTDSDSTVCSLFQAFVAMSFPLFSTLPCFDKRLRELKFKKETNKNKNLKLLEVIESKQ